MPDYKIQDFVTLVTVIIVVFLGFSTMPCIGLIFERKLPFVQGLHLNLKNEGSKLLPKIGAIQTQAGVSKNLKRDHNLNA